MSAVSPIPPHHPFNLTSNLLPPLLAAREIGYLFGQYKRITRDFTGVLTGKG